MHLFQSVSLAPPDPILGLTDAFKAEKRTDKINLGVGIYQDAQGRAPVLASVKAAEARIIQKQATKSYLPISGSPAYTDAVQNLVFGSGHALLQAGRVATVHTPGGTGALRVAADFIAASLGRSRTVWVSDPTWANHNGIFGAAGLPVKSYRYFDAAANGLDFAGMQAALGGMAAGDVVLLHGCCHNPSGVDPLPAQWETIAEVCAQRGLLAVLDFAYQGFGDGLVEDAASIRAFAARGLEFFVCSSFSKNFGLYNDRVGALTVVAANPDATEKVLSQLKIAVRVNYSNPPAWGGEIVATILGDAELRRQWELELAEMRNRINGVRAEFVAALASAGASRDFGFIGRQKGMFSFSGLNKEQVATLRDQHAIYMVGNGRINVAGISAANIGRLCKAIVSVL